MFVVSIFILQTKQCVCGFVIADLVSVSLHRQPQLLGFMGTNELYFDQSDQSEQFDGNIELKKQKQKSVITHSVKSA